MVYSLTWLPAVLKAAGLKVATVPGWEERGHGDMGTVSGVLCHHTAAGNAPGNMPTLGELVRGRTDPTPLAGPLAQLGLGRDGTFYIVAAGRCYHAGVGQFQGISMGNTHFIGIEAENTGAHSDPWPIVQIEAYQHGVAAILRHISKGAEYCAGHKEYALPKGRKVDPDFDMVPFRAAIASILTGATPPPTPIPAAEPVPVPGKAIARPTLRRGNTGAWVLELQTRLGVTADSVFGGKTEAAVRALQRTHQLVPDGIVGPSTWRTLDSQLNSSAGAKPANS